MAKLLCKGEILNDGGSNIIEKGFFYSDTEPYPILGNSEKWDDIIDETDEIFVGTITGLTESTEYRINSYAINSNGINYSINTSTITTYGEFIKPTINLYIKDDINRGTGGAEQPQIFDKSYEMGTSNPLIVFGNIQKNNETIFNGGWLDQISSPSVNNPILTWAGYKENFDTSDPPPISINFIPRANNSSSWNMSHKVTCKCGNPEYIIIKNKITNGFFPFLWVLKESPKSISYFQPGALERGSYFYDDASKPPDILQPVNGKKVEKKESKVFNITVKDEDHKCFILGYPSYYGDIEISLNNNVWASPSLSTYNVNTGSNGNLYGIVNDWSYSYKILQFTFNPSNPYWSGYSPVPIPFYIRFPDYQID